MAAYGGDVHYDASLFAKGILGTKGAEDEQILERSYGVSVGRARELNPNDHATLVTKVDNYIHKEMAEESEAAFVAFIETSNANRTLVPCGKNAVTLTKAFERLVAAQGTAIGVSNNCHKAAEWKQRNVAGTDVALLSKE